MKFEPVLPDTQLIQQDRLVAVWVDPDSAFMIAGLVVVDQHFDDKAISVVGEQGQRGDVVHVEEDLWCFSSLQSITDDELFKLFVVRS